MSQRVNVKSNWVDLFCISMKRRRNSSEWELQLITVHFTSELTVDGRERALLVIKKVQKNFFLSFLVLYIYFYYFLPFSTKNGAQ